MFPPLSPSPSNFYSLIKYVRTNNFLQEIPELGDTVAEFLATGKKNHGGQHPDKVAVYRTGVPNSWHTIVEGKANCT